MNYEYAVIEIAGRFPPGLVVRTNSLKEAYRLALDGAVQRYDFQVGGRMFSGYGGRIGSDPLPYETAGFAGWSAVHWISRNRCLMRRELEGAREAK